MGREWNIISNGIEPLLHKPENVVPYFPAHKTPFCLVFEVAKMQRGLIRQVHTRIFLNKIGVPKSKGGLICRGSYLSEYMVVRYNTAVRQSIL